MTPHELAKTMHRELSPVAPRLAAALNRALLDIGEGSVLVGLGPGTHQDDPSAFNESDRIVLGHDEPAAVIARITQVLWQLEEHSPWKVLIDTKPRRRGATHLELLYTIFRMKET
jgi:hypothetical protein